MEDCLGLAVTCESEVSLAALNTFITCDTSYFDRNVEEVKSAALSLDCPLLQIFLGELHMWMDTNQAPDQAMRFLTAAHPMQMNERERMWLVAVESWAQGRDDCVIDRYFELVNAYPQDYMAARQGIMYCMRSGKQAEMLKFSEVLLSVEGVRDIPQALSIASFAYIENELLEQAEELATRALELDPNTAWAQHNMAHVHATRDEFELGLQFLKGKEKAWKGEFIYTHNSWHTAIFHVLLCQKDEALRILSDNIIAFNWWHYLNRFHMLALLMYLDLVGENVVDLFPARLISELQDRDKWTIDPLVDMLAVWALCKTGHVQAASELAKLSNLGEVWEAGVRVMTFLGSGERSLAARELHPYLRQMSLLGSSNEQRKTISDACLLTRSRTLNFLLTKTQKEIRESESSGSQTLD
jgi:tetratricopeptide (TPR) repeat protein